MRLPAGLLLASTVSGLLAVAAALLAMPGASRLCGAVMLLGLLGYVVVTDRGVRRLRWVLIVGIGLLALVAAARLFWQQVGAAGWLTYGQLAETATLARWREMIDRERLAAAGGLLGVLCLAAAVLALPTRDKARRGVVTTLLALLLLAWFGLRLARGFGRYPLFDLLATVWPALLGTLVAMGTLALSGWRADRRWLLPVGSLLLTVAAAGIYSDLAAAWSGWWTIANPRDDAFLSAGLKVSTAGFPQISWAVETAIALAGPGLVAIGALHSSSEADRE